MYDAMWTHAINGLTDVALESLEENHYAIASLIDRRVAQHAKWRRVGPPIHILQVGGVPATAEGLNDRSTTRFVRERLTGDSACRE